MLTKPMTRTVTILVVDDHPIVAAGLRLFLAADSDLVVTGDAASASEAISKAALLQPSVVLLDLRLPGSDIEDTAASLRIAAPNAKIVVLTAYSTPAAMAKALAAGVDGFLLKDVSEQDIADSVRRVAAGGVFRPPRRCTAKDYVPPLTRREIEVLRGIAMGCTNAEVAGDLRLSNNTVKSYLQSAMQKLGARNRVEAITRANETGLL